MISKTNRQTNITSTLLKIYLAIVGMLSLIIFGAAIYWQQPLIFLPGIIILIAGLLKALTMNIVKDRRKPKSGSFTS